jgi:serine/threonine-protein kinase
VHKVCPECRDHFSVDLEACPADGARLEEPKVAADPLIGQLLADRYRVLRTIGEGGMGRVYLAEHERMGRLSAVKVMSAQMAATPEAISRFNREAANASRIHQPNVAAIYDFGETADGTLYLAMEFVEGETLSALLQREAPLLPARAAELTGQIADGLHAAHHLGIVHRDLKPDNVIVTKHLDGREWVKIVDFGIAKTVQKSDQTVTSLGVAIGTPEYMSPEQIAGENLDARTDLYSLGLVLFNMLTGVLPHPQMTSKQSLVMRLTAKPRALAEVRPNVAWPPRLQKVLDRALAPEPDDRYSSVGDFARDVRGAVGMPMFVGAAGAPRLSVTPAFSAPPADTPENVTPARSGVVGPMSKQGQGGSGLLVAAVLLLVMGGAVLAIKPPPALRKLMLANGVQLGNAAPVKPAAVDSTNTISLASSALSASADSAARAAATLDSTRAMGDSLSPIDGALRLRNAAMHDARRADGDSLADGTRPAVMQSAESDARELLVNVKRARDLTRSNQLPGAGLELRTAYQMYRIFLTEHAAAPQTESLRAELQTAMDEAIAACHAASDAARARGGKAFKCEHPAKSGILVGEEIPNEPPAPVSPVPEP